MQRSRDWENEALADSLHKPSYFVSYSTIILFPILHFFFYVSVLFAFTNTISFRSFHPKRTKRKIKQMHQCVYLLRSFRNPKNTAVLFFFYVLVIWLTKTKQKTLGTLPESHVYCYRCSCLVIQAFPVVS